jgi:hypothetical protein
MLRTQGGEHREQQKAEGSPRDLGSSSTPTYDNTVTLSSLLNLSVTCEMGRMRRGGCKNRAKDDSGKMPKGKQGPRRAGVKDLRTDSFPQIRRLDPAAREGGHTPQFRNVLGLQGS